MKENSSMSKALSIKDAATYELVAEISARTGLSMTQAVKKAATTQLQQLEAERIARLEAWVALVEANPLPEGFEFVRDTTPYVPRDNWP
jgi:hypothetical protein